MKKIETYFSTSKVASEVEKLKWQMCHGCFILYSEDEVISMEIGLGTRRLAEKQEDHNVKVSIQKEKWTEEDNTKEEERQEQVYEQGGDGKMSKHEEFVRSMKGLMKQDDYGQMFLRYRGAAESGKAWAFRELGRCSLNGVGTCINEDMAFRYFEEAARRGDPRAWRCLAYCYGAGVGVSLDLSKMEEYLVRGAEEGDDEAQRLLGAWYMNRKPADREEAGKWLKKAAEQGNEEAKEMLHVIYPVKEFMERGDDREI